MSDGWIENNKGNWVLRGDGVVYATVYATNSGWGAIWNGGGDGVARRLKAKFEDAGEAIDALESAAMEGDASAKWYPPDEGWKERKKGGYYRKVHGAVVSVKQAKSGSWYAVHMDGGLLGQSGRPMWFHAPDEVCKAVDELDDGSDVWHWITRQ